MTNTKIQRTHCDRIAFVYVRQSTSLQVIENRESTERQYNLRERAIELGWPPSQVEIIDEDQGRSGSTAAYRTGFQRLAAEVVLGKVGIVLMLEASRLARNNSDWYRLIEICGVSGTLIADESAVYNPREPNDRLLLGVKGTLSEAELFTLRTRLYEGRWNKARKGLLHFLCRWDMCEQRRGTGFWIRTRRFVSGSIMFSIPIVATAWFEPWFVSLRNKGWNCPRG